MTSLSFHALSLMNYQFCHIVARNGWQGLLFSLSATQIILALFYSFRGKNKFSDSLNKNLPKRGKRNFFAYNLTFSNFFKMSFPEFGSFQKSADKEIKIQIAVTFKSCVGSTGDILIWKKKRLHLRFETLKFGLASPNWRRHCDVEGGCHC